MEKIRTLTRSFSSRFSSTNSSASDRPTSFNRSSSSSELNVKGRSSIAPRPEARPEGAVILQRLDTVLTANLSNRTRRRFTQNKFFRNQETFSLHMDENDKEGVATIGASNIDELRFAMCTRMGWPQCQILTLARYPIRTTPELLNTEILFALPIDEARKDDVTRLPFMPQGPPPFPFIGNIPHISRSLSLQTLQMFKEYGSCFQLQLLGKPFYLLSDADVVKEVFENPRLFPKKNDLATLKELREPGGNALFTADDTDEEWGIAHRILLPAFSRSNMEKYATQMGAVALKLVECLSKRSRKEEIDILEMLKRMTFDIIGQCSFGHDFGAVNQSTDVDAIVLTKKILQGAVSRARRTDVGKAISFLEANKYHARVKEFLKIPEDILKQRLREDDAERAKHHDILSRMISSSDPYTQQQLSYENIIHQCATFLLVGHDTTASMITWALYHIISDAEVERKVLEEIFAVMDHAHDSVPTGKQLSKLKYLTQVIKETLRLHPSIPLIVKGISSDAKLGNFRISKDGVIAIHMMALMRSEKYWGPDPEKFDPDRFSPENMADRHVYAWIPFSAGPRGCIGAQFAIMEGLATLSVLLRARKFRIKSSAVVDHITTVTMSPTGILLRSSERKIKKVKHSKSSSSSLAVLKSMKKSRSKESVPGLFEQPEILKSIRPTITPKARLSSVVPMSGPGASVTIKPKGLDDTIPEVSMLVLYGSNSGTALDIAHRLAKSGESVLNGLEISDIKPLDFYVGKINPVEHPLILIVSSTYEDAPPQNALAFSAWLDKLILESSDANDEINPGEEIAGPPRDPPPSPEEYRMSLLRGKSRSVKRVNPFKGVKFSVLGVGNSQWVTYQTAAKRLDEKIEKLGGRRLLKMGEMDVDGKYEEDLLAWKKKWLQSILNEFISFEDTSDSFVFDEIKVRNSVKMSPQSK